MDYRESRNYIEQAEKYAGPMNLDALRELMNRLGNVQEDLKIVHVAGTNGKGSVIAFLYSILQKAHLKTGRYTSPSVYSYREKMEADGHPVSREQFASIVTRIAGTTEEMVKDGFNHPTPFEIETAAAWLFFAEEKCDIVLMETGMGGIDDATNLISKPLLSVITSIGLDHTAWLGASVGEIARKKAGIIKAGCPVVTVQQPPEAMQVLLKACREKDSPLTVADQHRSETISLDTDGQVFRYRGCEYRLPLMGAYQKDNAILSLEAAWILKSLGLPVTDSAVQQGLSQAAWPGRCQVLLQKPWVIVDGAHNPPGAMRLRETMEKVFPRKRFIVVMAVFSDKDHEKILEIMAPCVKKMYATETPGNKRSLPAEALCREAEQSGIQAQAAGSPGEALLAAIREAKEEDVILCFGTLSFLGILEDTIVKCRQNTQNCLNTENR